MSIISPAIAAPLQLPDAPPLQTTDPTIGFENACARSDQAATTPCDAQECACLTPASLEGFRRICEKRQLHAVFQPILDYRQHRYTGFEGLIRGPAGTPLHAPQALFCLARRCGLAEEFERLCREIVLSAFARLDLPGLLFLNVSASCLANPHFIHNGHTGRLLQELGLRPGRVVIEITENQKITDFAALHETMERHRAAGYRFAIDDLGEGFANLRLWSEIRPEFVKIDKHFIRGIADDPLKFRLVQAMRDIAENTHSELIAEGIETESEFSTLRDLGITHGQGYLIARPAPEPERQPHDGIYALLQRSQLVVFPQRLVHKANSVRELLEFVPPISPQTTNDQAFELFESQPQRSVLPVVDDGRIVGVINRLSLIDRFARPFRRELFGRRPCTLFMNAAPIVVDHTTSIHDLGLILGHAESHQLADGFVITENGRYLGWGSSQALMKLITEMQMRAARYANPLTQLPGNVPINEHIDRLLANQTPFVACYCDVDHFKPYNDCYGYRQGDQIIMTLGAILSRHANERFDFVGHIGGDDFVIIFQSPDWESRCHAILDDFAASMSQFVSAEHLSGGGYHAEDRRGNTIFHPLPSLSIGALVVEAQRFASHREVSGAVANAKKQAKKMPGNALFIERRRQAIAQIGQNQ